MQEELNKINAYAAGGKKKLLLHSCCAPCSSASLELLHDKFDITILYYNPNIEDKEYQKRKEEQIRLLNETNWAKFIDCEHESEKFYEIAKGHESDPEPGARCYSCYMLRLEKAAIVAKENNFDLFGTTLSISPYKVPKWLSDIGNKLQDKYNIEYFDINFNKAGLFPRSIELCYRYDLYQQNYCGCEYSKATAV